MTLRLKENHLRIRVTQSDLHAFRREGHVERTTRFGRDAALTCALAVVPDAGAPTAHLDGRTVTVRVPAALAEEWATTDRVGFEAEQPAGDGTALRLLVEKDVGCQHEDDPARDEKFTELANEQQRGT